MKLSKNVELFFYYYLLLTVVTLIIISCTTDDKSAKDSNGNLFQNAVTLGRHDHSVWVCWVFVVVAVIRWQLQEGH
jgi:hypothetical protein